MRLKVNEYLTGHTANLDCTSRYETRMFNAKNRKGLRKERKDRLSIFALPSLGPCVEFLVRDWQECVLWSAVAVAVTHDRAESPLIFR